MSLWINNGKLVIDDTGALVLCDVCPCGVDESCAGFPESGMFAEVLDSIALPLGDYPMSKVAAEEWWTDDQDIGGTSTGIAYVYGASNGFPDDPCQGRWYYIGPGIQSEAAVPDSLAPAFSFERIDTGSGTERIRIHN